MSSAIYTGGQPFTVNSPTVNTHFAVATGYDVRQISNVRKSAAARLTNGQLHNGDNYVNLFVSDVTEDIALGGATAQSQFKRDFYAKNFTQPSFLVSGQCLDQEDYGLLCEFVHRAQHIAVREGRLLQLTINGNKWPSDWNPINVSNGQQTIKGPHKPIIAKGHVKSMPRIHQKFVYAPEFQFSFVVDQMLSGIYQESSAVGNEQQSWSDIMLNQIGHSTSATNLARKGTGAAIGQGLVQAPVTPISSNTF